MIEYETWEDVRAGAELSGFDVSRHKLERWRGMGLLPKVKQIGLGRAAGSQVHYPSGTTAQVIAIAEAFSIKRKQSFVGWRLWLQGYEVDERYWRPHMHAGVRMLREAQQWIMDTRDRDDLSEETDFDRLAPELARHSSLQGALRFLSIDMLAYIAGTFGDIIVGRFHGFSPSYDIDEVRQHRTAFQTAMGVPRRGLATDLANELGLSRDLESQLRGISSAFHKIHSYPDAEDVFVKPIVRKELWQSIQILHDLHAILIALRKSPFRMADTVVNRPETQALMLIIWAVFRNFGTIRSSEEIDQIARIAGAVRKRI